MSFHSGPTIEFGKEEPFGQNDANKANTIIERMLIKKSCILMGTLTKSMKTGKKSLTENSI